MKIGIVSEFNTESINYGNHLQAYALNAYIRSIRDNNETETILLASRQLTRLTNVISLSFCKKMIYGIMRRIFEAKRPVVTEKANIERRGKLFADFRQKHIPMTNGERTAKDICQAGYDALVVGSDVVWMQFPHKVNRIKFLDLKFKQPVKRIAYAASFGRDYIPVENKKYIRILLNRFDAVSVRENSSVAMLHEIGVPNVAYCLDPTLLLHASHWQEMEIRPEAVTGDERFLFAYLLGDDEKQRTEIVEFAKKNDLKIACIPDGDGHCNTVEFGDILLDECSIENWLWLIHHAQMVITDSFHGIVFSTIFHKPFYAVDRVCEVDINNRIYDYLREINQMDKLIQRGDLQQRKESVWDYDEIENALDLRRNASKSFLEKALRGRKK